MQPNTRSLILWLIVLGAFFVGLWWCRPAEPLQSPKGAELFPRRHLLAVVPTLPTPLVSLPPVEYATNFWYFAATAENQAGKSDFSNEVSLTNIWSNFDPPQETSKLGWDPSKESSVDNYAVSFGSTSGVYTNVTNAGTNLSVTVRMIPLPPSNIVLTVTTTGLAIYRAPTPKGPWLTLGTTRYVATNPPSPMYFRGRGNVPNTVTISSRMQ